MRRKNFTKTPTVFESLCSSSSPQRHVISVLYASMFKEPHTSMHAEHAFWETQLGKVIEKKSWERVHWYIHKGSLNVNTQENGYKMKRRWYRTPDLLHKFFPTVTDRCWKCEQDIGTFLHIWWECPLIRPYWRRVHDAITAISLLPLEFSLAQNTSFQNTQKKIL